MAYAGEQLDQTGTINIDLQRISVVAVSGDGPNVCGHLILFAGQTRGGYYFHVADIHSRPRYMNGSGYQRYLRESGKVEVRRVPLTLPNPESASLHLNSLMAKKWLWGGVPNNCVTFVEDVVSAGGGEWSSISNCPAIATADTIEMRVNRFLNQLEGYVYSIYGVPHN